MVQVPLCAPEILILSVLEHMQTSLDSADLQHSMLMNTRNMQIVACLQDEVRNSYCKHKMSSTGKCFGKVIEGQSLLSVLNACHASSTALTEPSSSRLVLCLDCI